MTILDPEQAARDRAARNRFFAISLFRLSGALILVFGLAIAMERFGWVAEQNARTLGAIFVFVGFFQMVLIPRLLIRAFRTPPQ